MTAVVLVGLMGAGKSTVARLVSAQTGRRVVDVDVAITRRTGRTVRELWEEGGEAAYRALESQEVLQALAAEDEVVLAAPGGVVLDATVRAALADSFVVWLRADPRTLGRRVHTGDHRPLLGADPTHDLAIMARDRAELYAAVADAVIDTDQLSPQDTADAVLAALAGRTTGH